MKKHKRHNKHTHHFSWLDVGFIVILTVAFFVILSFMINSASFMLFGKIVTHVKTDQKVVALTFDDGPLPGATEETLKLLEQEKIHATFFVIGVDAKQHPDQLKKIIASGNEIGNHSYAHKNMAFMSQKEVATEIESNDALIRAAGYNGEIYFRTPYNAKFITLPYYLMSKNRLDISRDVLPTEGKDRTPQKIVDQVISKVKPGSIILLHPMYAHTATTRKAIVPLVETLKKQGYRFVTVSELLTYQQP